MMIQGFYTGIAGLKSHQTAIDIVSDNLANTNTIGYKSTRGEFSSLFEKTLSTPHIDTTQTIGLGSRIQATSINQKTGNLMLSDRLMDMALLEEGWFGIEVGSHKEFTRNGSFGFDKNSDLVTQAGNYVMGTLGKNISNGELTRDVDEIKLGNKEQQERIKLPRDLLYPAQPTKNVQFIGNIGTKYEDETISAGVIDKNGVRNELKLLFERNEEEGNKGLSWKVTATVRNMETREVYSTKEGALKFGPRGGLISNTLDSIDNNGTNIAIDLGKEFEGITSHSVARTSISSVSDGSIKGELANYSINKNGEVIATFLNGMQSSIAKIAVYHFQNDQGLQRVGGSNFIETSNSGDAFFYKNSIGENINGTDVASMKLEGSNVDLSESLTQLIVLQRAYDANSKLITTADQMMQKALSMDA